MLTAKELHPDIYPFKEGDRVFIKWAAPHGATDTGTIHKLCMGTHWGESVIYSVIVHIDNSNDITRAVSTECLFPISDQAKYNYQLELFT